MLIPGIQGRWEWMWPAVRALAASHRVLTFSLGQARPPLLFDQWLKAIDESLGPGERFAVAGTSFGGLVAAYYAGLRPERVSSLILASAPSPRWRLDARSRSYLRRPRLALPLFALRGAGRLYREVRAALPAPHRRARFAGEHLLRVLRYPASPVHMAQCVQEWLTTDLVTPCRRITAPTLVITGDPHLDHVVPVDSSLDYLRLIPNARHATMERTGHLGLVLRPEEFAALVADFVRDSGAQAADVPGDRRSTHSARDVVGSGWTA